VPILLVATLAVPLFGLGSVGSARADLIGVPTFIGFVTNDGYFFVEVGTSAFGSFTPLGPGSDVFGTGLTLVVFGITQENRSLDVRYEQFPGGNTTQYANSSFVVPGRSVTVATLTFPPTEKWIPATLTIDGTTLHYRVETPILLLPLANLTNGGFDLIILGILSELLIFTLPLIVLARYLTRRALWAPKVKAVLWLHGIVLGIASFVILDFPLVNEVAGGWGWFSYPIPLAVFLFFWSCSLFNRAEVVEVIRANTASGHRLSFDRWEVRIGRNRHGDLVMLGRRWRDWLFGALDHWVILSAHDAEEKGIEPEGHEVLLREVETGTERAKKDAALAKRRIRWPRSSKERPEDDFRVRNAQERGEDDPGHIYFVGSADPVEVEWCRWSIHRLKQIPDKYDAEGNLLVPAHANRALTWPHIIDGSARVLLAGIHYADVVAVAMGWKTVEDVVKVAEQRHLQVYVLKAHLQTEVARQVEEKLTAYLDLTTRPGMEISEEEADAEVERKPRRAGAASGAGPTEPHDKPEE
jgi:hypothetical protein